MLYRVVTAKILNDGTVQEGKRKTLYPWPAELNVGGLYLLGHGLPGELKLYRIVEKVGN